MADAPIDLVRQALIDAAAAKQGITGLQYAPVSSTTGTTTKTSTNPAPLNTITSAPAAKSTISTLSTISAIAPLASKFISGAAGAALGTGLSVLGVGLNAYQAFDATLNMFKNGFSLGKLGSLAMAAVSIELAAALPAIMSGTTIMFALSAAFPGTLIILGAVVLIAFIVSLFGNSMNAAESNINNFDNLTVWSKNQALLLTSATAFMMMGYNIDKAVTNLSDAGIAIPTSTLMQILSHNLVNADGSGYSGGLPYGVPIVIGGAGPNGGDQVMILSQGGIQNGKAMDNVKTYNLSKNLAFTKPTRADGAYIPFFGPDGKVNPQAVTALQTQRALLQSTPHLAPGSQVNAVAIAASANKQNVDVIAVP